MKDSIFMYSLLIGGMWKMYDVLEGMVKRFNLGGFGICKFSEVSMDLIKCRAMERIPKNTESIISFLFPYYVDIGVHNISRYAVVKDYHCVVMDILNVICTELKKRYKDFVFVPFSDNSPVPEVRVGVLSGLGVLGKNNLLINPKYGTWVFIGEILTDMEIKVEKRELKRCMECGACQGGCPSGALCGQSFRKDICISYVSQKKKLTSEYEVDLIKSSRLAWGCDICQEVCPMNRGKETTKITGFISSVCENVALGDYDLLNNRAFQWRSKEVIERNISLQLKLY